MTDKDKRLREKEAALLKEAFGMVHGQLYVTNICLSLMMVSLEILARERRSGRTPSQEEVSQAFKGLQASMQDVVDRWAEHPEFQRGVGLGLDQIEKLTTMVIAHTDTYERFTATGPARTSYPRLLPLINLLLKLPILSALGMDEVSQSDGGGENDPPEERNEDQ